MICFVNLAPGYIQRLIEQPKKEAEPKKRLIGFTANHEN